MKISNYNGKTKPPKVIDAPQGDNVECDAKWVALGRTPLSGRDREDSKNPRHKDGRWFWCTSCSGVRTKPDDWSGPKDVELIYQQRDDERYHLVWNHPEFDRVGLITGEHDFMMLQIHDDLYFET